MCRSTNSCRTHHALHSAAHNCNMPQASPVRRDVWGHREPLTQCSLDSILLVPLHIHFKVLWGKVLVAKRALCLLMRTQSLNSKSRGKGQSCEDCACPQEPGASPGPGPDQVLGVVTQRSSLCVCLAGVLLHPGGQNLGHEVCAAQGTPAVSSLLIKLVTFAPWGYHGFLQATCALSRHKTVEALQTAPHNPG